MFINAFSMPREEVVPNCEPMGGIMMNTVMQMKAAGGVTATGG